MAQQYMITSLHASGSGRFSEEQVLRASGLKLGEAITLETVRDAAQALVDSGAFAEVRYRHMDSARAIAVEFTLRDRPEDEFATCSFENIVWFPETELVSELQKRVPLFRGKVPLVGNLPEKIAGEISTMLHEKGVIGHVTASPLSDKAGNTVGYDFMLDDANLHIGEIVFTGASSSLAPDLQAAAAPLIGLTYHRSTVEGFAQERLRDFYLQRGYLQARFGPPVPSVAREQNHDTQVRVALAVTEGPLYRFGKVQWSGANAISYGQIATLVPTPEDSVVDGVSLRSLVRQLRRLYAEAGYLHMYLKETPNFHPDTGVVDYTMEVNEGPLFSMGKLEFSGVPAETEQKLRQVWKVREGEPFDEQYFEKFVFSLIPAGAMYEVDKSEGDRPNTVDVSIRLCAPGEHCRPPENHLYEPPVEKEKDKRTNEDHHR